MPRLPLARVAAVSVAMTAVLATASPAFAKGGSGGGGGSTPAPTPTPAPVLADCYGDPAIVAMTTPDISVNYAGAAGCVGVQTSASSLRLAWVVLNDGWTYVVKSNGGGTNSRVQLEFTQTSTGDRVDFRFEFGKTVVS